MTNLTSVRYIFLLLMINGHLCLAQDPAFSQFQYSPLLINPANATGSSYLNALVHYRNQYRSPNPNYRTPSFTFITPFINKKTNQRWGGIGLSAISDQTSHSALRQYNQGIALTYAHNVYMGKGHHLSLGVQGGYYQYGINSGDITTGEQYTSGGGYNSGLPTGEASSQASVNYLDLASGLSYIKEDSIGKLYFISLSAWHLNQPGISLLGEKNTLPIRFSAHAGFRLYANSIFSIEPEVLATQQNHRNRISVGAHFSYLFGNADKPAENVKLSLIPRYNLNNSVVAGIELTKSNFLVAFSYDFNTTPMADRISTTGAYEIAVGYRKYLGKKREKIILPDYSMGEVRKFYQSDNVQDISKRMENDRKANKAYTYNDADTNWNKTGDYKFELEKHFVFGFNESGIGDDAKKFADDLVALLLDNPHLKLMVIGYSDDVGSEKANLYISRERAHSFTRYIESKGIIPARLKYDGKGEVEPVTTKRTPADRAKNRRVRFLLY